MELIKQRVAQHKCTLCGKPINKRDEKSQVYKTTGRGLCCKKYITFVN